MFARRFSAASMSLGSALLHLTRTNPIGRCQGREQWRVGRTLVKWASHVTWSAPTARSSIGIGQQWRVFHRWQLGHPSTSVLFPFGDDFGLDDDDLARAELVTPFVQNHV